MDCFFFKLFIITFHDGHPSHWFYCTSHLPCPSNWGKVKSFHSILEDECYSRHEFDSFMEVYRTISEYIDYYNNRRRHSSIKYMAPNQFYKAFNKGRVGTASYCLILLSS
ncbi:IS3 family transposase [Desulfolucanica intricata]|uniref:IS3 family transposase n=1 Tax=Desulfolucanica intricata TaxID=1285191 RepID=UPI0009EDA366